MHHIYTTEALILKSTQTGEANRFFFLLTKDLGFIRASAQGIRFQKSKLNAHLQEFSLSSISLVRGKEVWRITSAEILEKSLFLEDQNKINVLKNIFDLLLRLLHGEEKNEFLFESISCMFKLLNSSNLNIEQLKNIETIVVLRIMNSLGYLREKEIFSSVVGDTSLSIEMLSSFSDRRKNAILEINKALLETHL